MNPLFEFLGIIAAFCVFGAEIIAVGMFIDSLKKREHRLASFGMIFIFPVIVVFIIIIG